jgi:hypothetical protein
VFENSLHLSQRQMVYLPQLGQGNFTAPFSGDTILPQLVHSCGLISDIVILLSSEFICCSHLELEGF